MIEPVSGKRTIIRVRDFSAKGQQGVEQERVLFVSFAGKFFGFGSLRGSSRVLVQGPTEIRNLAEGTHEMLDDQFGNFVQRFGVSH